MRHALSLARTGLGRTAPNPSVGCVLVKNGHVVGAARTGDGGRPHAEFLALKMAGRETKGATAYVTLEPCAHEGQTPSCARLLAEAGVNRVVVGCRDVDPRTAGQNEAGFEYGVLEQEAQKVSAGFFLRVTEERPFVSLKIACSVDGKTALADNDKQWITGTLARRYAHVERSQHDAIMVGIGTVLADDPLLTVRLGESLPQPRRIVMDAGLKIPLDCQLIETVDQAPLWIFYKDDPENKTQVLRDRGAKLIQVDPHDIQSVLKALAGEGVTRLLVEGGATVMTAFVESGLYDRFLCFRAPSVIGGDGRNGVSFLEIGAMEDVLKLKRIETRILGDDTLEVYERCLQD